MAAHKLFLFILSALFSLSIIESVLPFTSCLTVNNLSLCSCVLGSPAHPQIRLFFHYLPPRSRVLAGSLSPFFYLCCLSTP